jgi:hypothetical protein
MPPALVQQARAAIIFVVFLKLATLGLLADGAPMRDVCAHAAVLR